ncbi:MAG: TetR/AcrR family transcriptional regulator [Chloroflexota bacterium]
MAYAKSQETKKKLIRTMARLMHTQGYNATGISQILKESGVPKGSLYHHFPGGKTELAAAAVDRANSIIVTGLTEMAERANNDAAELARLFCNYFIQDMRQSNFQRGCPIALTTLDAAATVDAIQEQVELGYQWMIKLIKEMLMSKGVTAEESHTLATVAISAIEGALVVSAARRSVEPLEVVRDHLVAQLAATPVFTE